ncbi:alpha/beta hydrolase [Patiriisocius hiemis]|uniref:Alpha/beta hydrolase n=1 Tax=Patiriisocius hiemis TaxID=3075604 RepID=A0ABU2Y861_9FLAO|nr:alpha/beta hydrolase [Constantimarinum sp. W242]MDT0554377.1 alpha/beta hydrolase [Constantimarinum sp. W242]
MKKFLFPLLVLFVFSNALAQEKKYTEKELSVSKYIDGTLLLPSTENPKLVIIIAGSGPTDRNGNSSMSRNNSLKFLAEGLVNNGLAVFRYDKRSVKMLKNRDPNMANIQFNDFITDAEEVINYFKRSEQFSEIHVVGHSQGSLIGMLIAKGSASSFTSLAGTGQPIDDVIITQIAIQQPGLDKSAATAFKELRERGSTTNYDPALASILGPQIQPFMLQWMQFNPAEEIKKLDIPVLIINGTKDLQTKETEAALLKEAKPDALYKIIENMNHLFKKIEGNDLENQKSYGDPNLPVMPELIETISSFIKN